MKKLLGQRFLACALALCLLLGIMPTTALAASTEEWNAMNVRLDAAIAENLHIPKEVYDVSQHTLVAKDVSGGLEREYNNWPERYAALYDDGTLLISSDGNGTAVSMSAPVIDHASEVKLVILSDRVAVIPGFDNRYTSLETIVSLYDKPLETEPATTYGPGVSFNNKMYRPPNLKNIVIYGNIPRSGSVAGIENPLNIYYRDGYPDWEDEDKNFFRFPSAFLGDGAKYVTFQKFCSYTYDGGIDLEHGSTTAHNEKVLDYISSAAELYDTVSFCSKCGQEVGREHHYSVGGKQYNDYTPRELTVNMPTVDEIKAFFAAHPIKSQTTYTRAPAYAQEPYDLGAYDAATRKSIMNEINRYRFVAGVPAELEYNPTYEPQEMAAALVMKVGNQLSHSPKRTNGLEKPQYDDMLTHRWMWGANGSNIASWGNIMSAIQAFMWDSDASNVLAGLGHRRQVLKSNLQNVAAGEAGEYACLFVEHTKGASGGWYDPVAWPARNTPTSYFGGRWSVVYGGAKESLAGHKFRVEILSEDGDFYSTAESGSNTAVLVSDGQVNFGHTLTTNPDTIYSVAVFDDTAKTFMTYDVSFFEYTDEGHSGSTPEPTKPDEPAPDPKPEPEPDPKPGTTPEPGGKPAASSFTDVSSGAWYAEAVDWAVGLDITNGTGNGRFSPAQTCTQEQILTFLYRAARGSGKADPKDMVLAVDWAREKGMIDSSFTGKAPCTRSTAVYFIWQALGKESAKAGGFTDVPANAAYAKAVDWAVANGVTNGTNAAQTQFSPNQVCTRGHIVTFLHRAYVEEARLK